MKAFKIFSMAAVAFMMVACSSEDEALDNTPVAGRKVHFTATIAAPGSDASTRTTYTEVTSGTDAGKIKVAWEQGDEIALIHNGTKDVVTVQTLNADGSANISGDITVGTDGEAVTIVYPAASVDAPTSGAEPVDNATYAAKWNSQDGTLTYIQDYLDFCRATSTLKVSGTNATLNDNIALKSNIVIVKFSLSDGTNAINATQFLVRDGNDNVLAAVTPASATSTLYVAIPPATSSTFRFKAATATKSYFYSKSDVTITAGKYYQSSLKMAKLDMLNTPLTLEATEDGTTVTITNKSGVTFSYTVNGGTPVSTSSNASFTLQAGDKVQFNSTNSALGVRTDPGDPNSYNYLNIMVDKKSYVYGNVMSMVNDNGGDFAADLTLADYAMPKLFCGSFSADNHIAFLADKPLMLPATNISKYCYRYMFGFCTELSTLPSGFLPAKEMKEQCYAFIFTYCQGLIALPDDLLPAGGGGGGSLAKSCYEAMFQCCSGLTTLADDFLPATTLAERCYCDMFRSCSGLTTLADDFLPATTLVESCYNGMFHFCSGLTHAPILRAPTLVNKCYLDIFSRCSKLSEVTCLATNISASECLNYWLFDAGENVSGPKTVYVDPSMTTKGTGSGDGKWNLSDGWTLQNYVAP